MKIKVRKNEIIFTLALPVNVEELDQVTLFRITDAVADGFINAVVNEPKDTPARKYLKRAAMIVTAYESRKTRIARYDGDQIDG